MLSVVPHITGVLGQSVPALSLYESMDENRTHGVVAVGPSETALIQN